MINLHTCPFYNSYLLIPPNFNKVDGFGASTNFPAVSIPWVKHAIYRTQTEISIKVVKLNKFKVGHHTSFNVYGIV